MQAGVDDGIDYALVTLILHEAAPTLPMTRLIEKRVRSIASEPARSRAATASNFSRIRIPGLRSFNAQFRTFPVYRRVLAANIKDFAWDGC